MSHRETRLRESLLGARWGQDNVGFRVSEPNPGWGESFGLFGFARHYVQFPWRTHFQAYFLSEVRSVFVIQHHKIYCIHHCLLWVYKIIGNYVFLLFIPKIKSVTLTSKTMMVDGWSAVLFSNQSSLEGQIMRILLLFQSRDFDPWMKAYHETIIWPIQPRQFCSFCLLAERRERFEHQLRSYWLLRSITQAQCSHGPTHGTL